MSNIKPLKVLMTLVFVSCAVALVWAQSPPGAYTSPATSGTSFPLLAPSGSAAAPSYAFSTLNNTGMYLSGGNLAFSVGGGQLLIISGGGVSVGGVGTSIQSPLYQTGSNCSSSASPAVCGS